MVVVERLVLVPMAIGLTWRVSRASTSSALMQVRAQALDDLRTHMLAQLHDATIEVTGLAPADLGCAFAFCPVVHEILGVADVLG